MTRKHELQVGNACRHRHYWLQCEEADAMCAEQGVQCWLCGRADTLGFDHDETIGIWAVRGILCVRCNVHLENENVVDDDAYYAYMNEAWWRRSRSAEFVEYATEELSRRVTNALCRGSMPTWVCRSYGVSWDYMLARSPGGLLTTAASTGVPRTLPKWRTYIHRRR